MNIKRVVLLGFFLTSFLVSHNINAAYDTLIATYLQKTKFGLELYELSCVSEELFSIVEQDSLNIKLFEARLERAFDPRLNASQRYFHGVEFSFLLKKIENRYHLYPKCSDLLKKISNKTAQNKPAKSFSNIVLELIEYPEQVDDVFLICLMGDFPEAIWDDIKANKSAMYRFTSWTKFGFEEFRYYPSTLNISKGLITQRVIDEVVDKNKNSKNELIMEALGMIKATQARYKN